MMGNVIFGLLLAAYAFWVLSTVVVVLLENRQPVKTIAWVLVLILLPVVGLLFFYAFGAELRKERRLERSNPLMPPGYQPPGQSEVSLEEQINPHLQPLVRLYERHAHARLTNNNHVHIYSEGADFMLGLFQALLGARHHIHLQSYIIDDDALGNLLADILMSKVRQGVEVRLIYDDVGCWNVHDKFFNRMRRAGVEVQAFLPVRFPMFTHKINYRNHRKVCVVDGRIGFIGGMNLARRYVHGAGGQRWRDLHLRLEGGSVAELQRAFLADWSAATGILITAPAYFPTTSAPVARRSEIGAQNPALAARNSEPEPGHAALQVVTSDPVSHWPQILSGIVWMMLNCRRYIYIQTPYFMPTEPLLQAMRTAALSGVDVRLMVPQKPDGFWLRWANDSYFTDVLEAGVRLYTYRPGFLHSKALVADDEWATVGSANMDFRSFENNMEANAFIYDRDTALKIKHIFEEDCKGCKEIVLREWRCRSYRRRLLESFTRIFSPLL